MQYIKGFGLDSRSDRKKKCERIFQKVIIFFANKTSKALNSFAGRIVQAKNINK